MLGAPKRVVTQNSYTNVNPSIEDELSDEDLEARRSLDVGKEINIKPRDDGEAMQKIVQLRRSSRKRVQGSSKSQ